MKNIEGISRKIYVNSNSSTVDIGGQTPPRSSEYQYTTEKISSCKVRYLPSLRQPSVRMEAESVSIGGMLTELEELEFPPIEFDEKLWHAVVDRITVYHDDRLVYSLKDGTEITVEL